MSSLQKEEKITMYFTDDGFVISSREITVIITVIIIAPIILKILHRKIRNIATNRSSKSEDYPYSSTLEDVYKENDFEKDDLDTGRQEKVIFEENISGIPFRYNEKTRVLTIGDRCDSKNTLPIEVKLGSFDDLKEFVDRLEDYVNE